MKTSTKSNSTDYDEEVATTTNVDNQNDDLTTNNDTNINSEISLETKKLDRKQKKIITFINRTKSINASIHLYKSLYRHIDKTINKIHYPLSVDDLIDVLLKDIDLTTVDRLIKDIFGYIIGYSDNEYSSYFKSVISMIDNNKIICPIYSYKYNNNYMLNQYINSNTLIKNTVSYINKLLSGIKTKYNISINYINIDNISLLDLIDAHNKVTSFKRKITLSLLKL